MDFKSAVVGVTPDANKAEVQAAFAEVKVNWAEVGKIDWAALLAKVLPLLLQFLPLFLSQQKVGAFDWMALLKAILAILAQLFPPTPPAPVVPTN